MHEKELLLHGKDGHKVNSILNDVESHAKIIHDSEAGNQHIVFMLTTKQLKLLTISQKYRAIKSMLQIVHDVIENEVEHILEETTLQVKFKIEGQK